MGTMAIAGMNHITSGLIRDLAVDSAPANVTDSRNCPPPRLGKKGRYQLESRTMLTLSRRRYTV